MQLLRVPCFGLILAVFASIVGAQPADLVVQHANVITIDASVPRSRPFAVAGGNKPTNCVRTTKRIRGTIDAVEEFVG
jgi:hypothetical protein